MSVLFFSPLFSTPHCTLRLPLFNSNNSTNLYAIPKLPYMQQSARVNATFFAPQPCKNNVADIRVLPGTRISLQTRQGAKAAMPDLAQFALQNDLLLATGFNLLLNLPVFRYYWDPAMSPESLPQQPQSAPGPRVTVTQTVTATPKRITLSPTRTVHDTVTRYVTSVSTVVDRHWVTKWTHFPTITATPRGTFTEFPEPTAQPKQRYPPCVPLLDATFTSPTTSVSSWTWVCWILLPLLIGALGAICLSRLDLISKRVAKAEGETQKVRQELESEKKLHQQCQSEATMFSADLDSSQNEVQCLIESIAKRNDMFKLLGVFEDEAEIVDDDNLYRMARQRAASIKSQADQMHKIEAENAAQADIIRALEAENASIEDTFKQRLRENYVPGMDRSFQSLLDDKQREIHRWRDAFYRTDTDATTQQTYAQCEAQEAELAQLRPLPATITQLQASLATATQQIQALEQAKKDQGVADRRRWNREKQDLCEKHAKELKTLRKSLKEAKQRASSSSSSPSKTNKEAEHLAKSRDLLVGLKVEQHAVYMQGAALRRELNAMHGKVAEVVLDAEKVRRERDELRAALEDMEEL